MAKPDKNGQIRCTKCSRLRGKEHFYKVGGRYQPHENYTQPCTACRRAYKSTERYKAQQRAYMRERGQGKAKIKWQAKNAVYAAVAKGELPPAGSCVCVDCRKRQAQDYHHESYLPEHHLEVTPLCRYCHTARHRKQKLEENPCAS